MNEYGASELVRMITEDGLLHSAEAVYQEYRYGARWTVQAINPRQALKVAGVRGRVTFTDLSHYRTYRAGFPEAFRNKKKAEAIGHATQKGL